MSSIKTGMKGPVRAAGVHKGHYELTEAYVLVGGRENPCNPAGDRQTLPGNPQPCGDTQIKRWVKLICKH